MRGTEGGVTPSLRKRGEFVRYWEQSEDVVVEADPSKIGIEQENRPVPIPHALMPIKVENLDLMKTMLKLQNWPQRKVWRL